jgi:hypothetical protein
MCWCLPRRSNFEAALHLDDDRRMIGSKKFFISYVKFYQCPLLPSIKSEDQKMRETTFCIVSISQKYLMESVYLKGKRKYADLLHSVALFAQWFLLHISSSASSSQHIDEVRDEFKSQSGVIAQAHHLLTKYGRREFTDKLLIFAAFGFFVACVFYVIQKRLF